MHNATEAHKAKVAKLKQIRKPRAPAIHKEHKERADKGIQRGSYGPQSHPGFRPKKYKTEA